MRIKVSWRKIKGRLKKKFCCPIWHGCLSLGGGPVPLSLFYSSPLVERASLFLLLVVPFVLESHNSTHVCPPAQYHLASVKESCYLMTLLNHCSFSPPLLLSLAYSLSLPTSLPLSHPSLPVSLSPVLWLPLMESLGGLSKEREQVHLAINV